MNELANKVNAVLNTLQELDIKPTYDNLNKLFGCFHVLVDVRNELNTKGTEEKGEQDAT